MTSGLLDGVDWGIVAVFATLVLLEGLRRVPAGGLVVRGIGWTGWRPAGETERHTRWRLASWWSPVAPALVLPPMGAAGVVPAGTLAARLEVARRAAPWLATGGAVTLGALLLGVPIATTRLGGPGFLAGAAAVIALAFATAAAGAMALRRLDPAGTSPPRQVLGWCSPFASGRVLEGVYQAALAGASPAQALRALSGDRVFAQWARARAYDVVHRGTADPDLAAAADTATLEAIVAAEPRRDASARAYCPRCATVWVVVRETCPDCEVPALIRPEQN